LRLPADIYRGFIERFFSNSELIEVRRVEEKLRHTYLFSDAVTSTTLFSLAKNCRITELDAGESFVGDPEQMHLIGRGRLTTPGEKDAPVLGSGQYWGSDALFREMAEHAHDLRVAADATRTWVALESCEIYSVPLRLISRIPVVRWKLFEAFRNTHPYAAPRFRGTPR
jgi:hypothetical protein